MRLFYLYDDINNRTESQVIAVPVNYMSGWKSILISFYLSFPWKVIYVEEKKK